MTTITDAPDAITSGKTVYLVKYAISNKGEPREVVVRDVRDGYVYVEGWYDSYKIGRDVVASREEADRLILAMVERKIGQARKSLAGLEKIYAAVSARSSAA